MTLVTTLAAAASRAASSCKALAPSFRQNRMSERADRRSHLDLQINLLAEKEATKAIQLLQRMSRHLGIEDKTLDPEVRELSKDTAVEGLARELRDNLDKET